MSSFVVEFTWVYLWLLACLGLGSAQVVPTTGCITSSHYCGDGFNCLSPPQPTNGRWKAHRSFCAQGFDCDVLSGIEIPSGSHLVYSCNAGYIVEGNSDVYCTDNGIWSAIPSCILQSCVGRSLASHCLLWSQRDLDRDDYTYTPGVGRHKIHTRAVPWNEARLICEEEGGYLTIINSIAEANVISQLFNKSEPIVDTIYTTYASIGFHDLYKAGQYVTIHGQTLAGAGYSRWKDDQPDNGGSGPSENCGSVYRTGRLNDIRCDLKFPFVCEI